MKQLDPDLKTTTTSSLLKQLWSVRLELWRNRNEKKHGGTREEREENHQKKLLPRIAQAYEDQYTGLVPGARRSLFKISKATRLGFRAVTNERWLEMVLVAREANEERERKLLNRIPKLQTYYKLTRKGKARVKEEQSPEKPAIPQQLMSEYITIRWWRPNLNNRRTKTREDNRNTRYKRCRW